jgi:hypothetical protein
VRRNGARREQLARFWELGEESEFQVCRNLTFVSQPVCLQLITIKKTTNEVFPRPSFDPEQAVVGSDSTVQDHAPAHKNFREHYFARFGKGPAEAVKSGDSSTTSEVSQLDFVEK